MYYALLLWAPRLAGRHVRPDNDNTVTVATFSKLCAANWVMQQLVKAEAAVMFDYNIRGTARWIKSEDNILGDPLSRGDLAGFEQAMSTWKRPRDRCGQRGLLATRGC